MTEEQTSEESRKSARGRRAKKREEDILDTSGAEEPVVSTPVRKAAARKKPEGSAAQDSSVQDSSVQDSGVKKVDDLQKFDKGEPPSSPEQIVAQGEAWMEQLFENMRLSLQVSGRIDGENYVFNVSGPDADDMIGRSQRSPRLLSSMQTILSEKLGRAARGNVVVDLGGFKEQRETRLVDIAARLGATARKLKRPVTIAGLTSFERRVIHQELAESKGLSTESADHGILRKLRVLPK